MTRKFAEKVASFVSKVHPECKVYPQPQTTGTMRWVFASSDVVINVSHYAKNDRLFIENVLTQITREVDDEKMPLIEIMEVL
jgi:hypothetical protein